MPILLYQIFYYHKVMVFINIFEESIMILQFSKIKIVLFILMF